MAFLVVLHEYSLDVTCGVLMACKARAPQVATQPLVYLRRTLSTLGNTIVVVDHMLRDEFGAVAEIPLARNTGI